MRLLVGLLLLCSTFLSAQEPGVYLLSLTDKASLASPEEVLSERSIARRAKQNIPFSTSDFPVNSTYTSAIESAEIEIVGKSKWFNSVTVSIENESQWQVLQSFAFVKSIELLKSWNALPNKSIQDNKFADETEGFIYGGSDAQIDMLNGQFLHFNGYVGSDMLIAVMDGGFVEAENMYCFEHLFESGQIIDRYNFVDKDEEVFQYSSHGTRVLSIMGGIFHSDSMVYRGTATGADYCLYVSEDVSSETRLEEFNWLMAAERADSVGADVLSTSLGYSTFDDPLENYTYDDMDGNTTIITRAADMAAEKGMLVVNSAGNSGNNPWLYMTAPADGDSVLAVGAVNVLEQVAGFSSRGPTFDGQVKPDVVAVGSGTSLISTDNNVTNQNGTSFSCPVIAGLATCLWQAAPEKSNVELMNAIRESASNYATPDSLMGYGIPDFAMALDILTENIDSGQGIAATLSQENFHLYPNPYSSNLFLSFYSEQPETLEIELITMDGKTERLNDIEIADAGVHTIDLTQYFNQGQSLLMVKCKLGESEGTYKVFRQ